MTSRDKEGEDEGGPSPYPTQDAPSCVRRDPIESYHLVVAVYIFSLVGRSLFSSVVVGSSSTAGWDDRVNELVANPCLGCDVAM